MEAQTNGLRETYFSESYKNKLYEKEFSHPKNLREFMGTYQQDNAAFHDFGRSKDQGVVKRRGLDHRDLVGASHRPNTITGSYRKQNLQVDQFKHQSAPVENAGVHAERKHYAYK